MRGYENLDVQDRYPVHVVMLRVYYLSKQAIEICQHLSETHFGAVPEPTLLLIVLFWTSISARLASFSLSLALQRTNGSLALHYDEPT